MQKVAPFIQLFRFDPSDKDHNQFEYIIINTKCIHMVEWHKDWDFVAIVCHTDHPEGEECYIEDYGNPKEARKRYGSLQTMLGANDGTAFDREKLMRKTMKEKAETDAWFKNLIQKAKAAGYDPFKDEDEKEDEPEGESDG